MVERTPISTNLLDPEIMKKWKAERKRFVVEGGKVAYIRTDPEFGDTPVLRKIGVDRIPPNVKNRNEVMKRCAKIIDDIVDEGHEEIDTVSPYDPSVKGKRTIKYKYIVGPDGVKYLVTRDAIRAGFSVCLRGEYDTNKIKKAMLERCSKTVDSYIKSIRKALEAEAKKEEPLIRETKGEEVKK